MAVLSVEGFRSVFFTELRSEKQTDASPVTPPKDFDSALAEMVAKAQQKKAEQDEEALKMNKRPKKNVLPISIDHLAPVASKYPLFVSPDGADGIETVTYKGTAHVDNEPLLVFAGRTGEETYRVQVASRGGQGLLVARQKVQPFGDEASARVEAIFKGVNTKVKSSLTEALGVPVTRTEIGYKRTEALIVTFGTPRR